MRSIAAVLPAILLAACLPAVDQPQPKSGPRLDPIAFFAGKTEGRGALHKLVGNPQRLAVESMGTRLTDGSLVLDQRIQLGGEPARSRRWIIRPLGNGRFTGTLTEAIGPVDAIVSGNRMMIRYRTDGYQVRQTLALGTDGIVRNRLDIFKWGLNVARLDERIARKTPVAD